MSSYHCSFWCSVLEDNQLDGPIPSALGNLINLNRL